jgi:hypothetical protein
MTHTARKFAGCAGAEAWCCVVISLKSAIVQLLDRS